MKMYGCLICVEYEVYHSVMYFLLYLDCEKLCEIIDLYDLVDVGECIYANHDDNVVNCLCEHMHCC